MNVSPTGSQSHAFQGPVPWVAVAKVGCLTCGQASSREMLVTWFYCWSEPEGAGPGSPCQLSGVQEDLGCQLDEASERPDPRAVVRLLQGDWEDWEVAFSASPSALGPGGSWEFRAALLQTPESKPPWRSELGLLGAHLSGGSLKGGAMDRLLLREKLGVGVPSQL